MSEYKTLGDAQDALVNALKRKRWLETRISDLRDEITSIEERITPYEEELRDHDAEARRAPPLVAMGFHMTATDDLKDAEK